MPRLLLVDGHSNLYRAFFAIRTPLSAPDGTPTAAAYGFLRMLHGALRGQARAARRLSDHGDGELVAAFLVARGEWMRLLEKATRWEGHHPEVELRVTGPWPPFDFVSVLEPGAPEVGADADPDTSSNGGLGS